MTMIAMTAKIATVENRSRIRLMSTASTVTIARVAPATEANAIRTYACASGASQLLDERQKGGNENDAAEQEKGSRQLPPTLDVR
ncbi:hypothetical protein [Agromyces bauzanensis]